MDTLINDLRHAFRLIRRQPALTAAVLFTLALGIGANTAVFSVVHAVLLRPLPYADPERLVLIWEKRAQEGVFDNFVSPADYLDWVQRSRSFAALGAYSAGLADLTGSGDPVQIPAGSVTSSFFDVLGVRVALGRTFRAGDERNTALPPVVIGHTVWRDRFGGRADVIGQRIGVNGQTVEIIGVLPRAFEFLPPSSSRVPVPFEAPLVWTVLALDGGSRPPPRAAHFLLVYGRLADGMSIAAAADEMDRLGRTLEAEFPNENRGHGAHVVGLHEQMVGRARGGLLLIAAAVSFLLLIGCTNVASLLLAQSVARRRELAVRAAVGAGRVRLLQQSFTESLVLSALGGVAGLLVAWGTLRLLVAQTPPVLSGVGLDRATIDLPVLGVAALLIVISGLLAGALPAWHAGGDDPVRALNAGGRSPLALGRGLRLALIGGEIALTVILLVGAGLMLRSFGRVLSQPPGFEMNNRLTATIALPASRYPDRAALGRARLALDERLATLPGVLTAGATNMLPLTGSDRRGGIVIEGQEDRPGPTRAHPRTVTPRYFDAVGLQLVSGRPLRETDSSTATPVAVINETMARRYWPGQEARGRRVRFSDESTWLEIVGIIRDVKHWGLDQEVNPELYIPFDQRPAPVLHYVLHTTGDPMALGRLVAAEVQAFDRDLPVGSVRTFETVAAQSVASHRWSALLLSLFAGLGILLAGAGVYGVMAHLVAMRTGEIGIRLSLGARPAQVLRQVMLEALGVATVGAAIGLAVAVAATRSIRSLLFGIEPTDPVALASAGAAVLLVTAAAASIPAIRAMRIDPVAALRQ